MGLTRTSKLRMEALGSGDPLLRGGTPRSQGIVRVQSGPARSGSAWPLQSLPRTELSSADPWAVADLKELCWHFLTAFEGLEPLTG